MTKSLSWFPFEPAKYLVGRISRLPLDAQGAFIRLCCVYWSKDAKLTREDCDLEVGEEIVEKLLKYKILKSVGDMVKISFLDDCREDAMEVVSKAKRAGKASAEKRKSLTDVEQEFNTRSTPVERPLNDRSTPVEHIHTYIHTDIHKEKDTITTTSLYADADDVVNSKNWQHTIGIVADESWLAVAAMNNSISMDTVKDYCISFYMHLVQEGKMHERFSDYRKHCNNWIRVQTREKINPKYKYDKEQHK